MTGELLLGMAQRLPEEKEDDKKSQQDRCRSWAKTYRDQPAQAGIERMLLKQLELVIDAGTELNQDAGSLPVENGVLVWAGDRFQLLRHDRRRLISRVAPVVYDPSATCPLWLESMAQWHADEEMRAYVQAAVGLSIMGEGADRQLFICTGTGGNGKGVMLDTIAFVLGPLTSSLTAAAIEVQRHADPENRGLLQLKDSRFTVISETNPGAHLNTAVLKQLTGGDMVRAAAKYVNPIEFINRSALWLMTNHRPSINDLSVGIWERVKIIPFTATWDEDDPDRRNRKEFDAALRAEASGILNWCLNGYAAYVQAGNKLVVPAALDSARKAYEFENDHERRFVVDCCEPVPDVRTTAVDLHRAYRTFMESDGLVKLTKGKTNFIADLRDRQRIPYKKIDRRWFFIGVRLVTAERMGERDFTGASMS